LCEFFGSKNPKVETMKAHPLDAPIKRHLPLPESQGRLRRQKKCPNSDLSSETGEVSSHSFDAHDNLCLELYLCKDISLQ
jgi:hypothetical protein